MEWTLSRLETYWTQKLSSIANDPQLPTKVTSSSLPLKNTVVPSPEVLFQSNRQSRDPFPTRRPQAPRVLHAPIQDDPSRTGEDWTDHDVVLPTPKNLKQRDPKNDYDPNALPTHSAKPLRITDTRIPPRNLNKPTQYLIEWDTTLPKTWHTKKQLREIFQNTTGTSSLIRNYINSTSSVQSKKKNT